MQRALVVVIVLSVALVATRTLAQPADAPPDANGSAVPLGSDAGSGQGSAVLGSGGGSGSGVTEDLLAHINDDTSKAEHGGEHGETFGTQLKLFGMETIWSGYGDLRFDVVPSQKVASFDATHFNPVLSVRMSDTLSGEMELEFEHGGLEINAEYAMVDYAPLNTRELVIRIGKFLIPFGRFNEQLHPSFRWAQISRPLMMTEVVPVEWSDVGLQVRGQIKNGDLAFDYAVYVVNGLNEHPMGMVESDDEGESGFIASLRSNLADSNWDKAIGGRFAITSSSSESSIVSFGVSGYTGRTSPTGDDAGPERLTMVDIDGYARQGHLFINGEYCQTWFGSQSLGYFHTFERGAYVQLGVTVGRNTVAGRYDYSAFGSETDGLPGPLTGNHAIVGSYRFSPTPTWSLRAEISQPLQPTTDTQLSAGIAFVF